jgi:hypothetical protein
MTPTLRQSLALLAGFHAVIAVPTAISGNVSTIKGKTYDYVIVGGGLTGLVVANRLSEDKSRKYAGAGCVSLVSSQTYRFCARS